ncbi:hypothetical protein Q8A67_012389 [Cirrhinus molitorella]|uniref:Uncharacterized protein n=1 Tax=Cirrhinus molitorella TaxID=172907 RepID=A0AA88PJK5_9TELE|nr:hypothetical protein Q8A67_012389 [Cirrhinus molitorella]
MVFIKKEREDAFSLKREDTEEQTGFVARTNERGKRVLFLEGEHISIQDMKMRPDPILEQEHIQRYLSKCIPDYPTPVEFNSTELTHVTNKTRVQEIWKLGGFKGLDKDSFSWWSLKINEADIRAAEERYLESLFPNRSEEEKTAQHPFLSQFTTSPAFDNKTSRYGNFNFTFPLTELMEAYKIQKCDGEEPILRIYGTKVFKKEIGYVVLVHSPVFNKKFSQFPELTSSPLVAYDGKKIIWKAQAICGTHNYQTVISGNTAFIQRMRAHQFYVWDHISLVFHTKDVLTFPKRKMKTSLNWCNLDLNVNLSNGEQCPHFEAEEFIKSLQVDDEEQDGEE